MLINFQRPISALSFFKALRNKRGFKGMAYRSRVFVTVRSVHVVPKDSYVEIELVVEGMDDGEYVGVTSFDAKRPIDCAIIDAEYHSYF